MPEQLDILFILCGLLVFRSGFNELLHVLDRPRFPVVDHPVQQTVLRIVVHAGDLKRCGLRQSALFPRPANPWHLEPVFDRAQVGEFCLIDLHRLGHAVADAPRKIFARFAALDVDLRQPLGLLRQHGR